MSTEDQIDKFVTDNFEATVVEPLKEFIRIPNQSRNYDKDYLTNGLLENACNFVMDWARKQGLENFSVEMIKDKDRTPCVLAVVDKPDAPTILMYGHIDKQPPLTDKWREGLGPYLPVIEGERLYGRGGADDGYAFFACVFIAKALQKFGAQKHRFVFFFECDEESGSKDLVHYLDSNAAKIGTPEMVICLDSGTVDYEHLSLTTTLRGVVVFTVKVEVTKEGVHSGAASGIIPDTFVVARDIFDKFQCPRTGQLIPELYVNIPKDKYIQACDLITELKNIDYKFPFLSGVKPITSDPLQQQLNRHWNPTCTLIGFDGLPRPGSCGNVMNPVTTYVFSVRLPPTLPHATAITAIKNFFENTKHPSGAKVTITDIHGGSGLNVNAYSQKTLDLLDQSARKYFNKVPLYIGEGGSIPFLNDIQNKFKSSEILVAGVLGPESNAHGPNEFIHLGYTKNLIRSFVHFFRHF